MTDYPDERETLCIGVFGEGEDFFTLKGLCETVADALNISFRYAPANRTYLHPYQTAEIFCDGECVGVLGKALYEICDELDMRVPAYVAQIDMRLLSKYYGKLEMYQPLPKFDIEKRDFAFVCDRTVTCQDIEDTIYAACSYVTDVKLFDVYEGGQIPADKKSMAFTVVFTPKEEAFGAESVDAFVKKILKQLNKNYGVELRS